MIADFISLRLATHADRIPTLAKWYSIKIRKLDSLTWNLIEEEVTTEHL